MLPKLTKAHISYNLAVFSLVNLFGFIQTRT